MEIEYIARSRYGTFPKWLRQMNAKIGVEVGVSSGYFSKHLARFVPHMKVFAIDPYIVFSGCTHGETQVQFDALYERAKARLSPFPNCQLIRDTSKNASKLFGDKTIDFVYIDAAHDYDSVYEDITLWYKKVKKGGIVAGHDYLDPIEPRSLGYYKEVYDVKHAVNDWAKKHKIPKITVFNAKKDITWFFIK